MRAGAVLTPLLAWLLPAWRPLTALTGASVIVPLLLSPFISESPRWLLAQVPYHRWCLANYT